jgi:hypothetical protein
MYLDCIGDHTSNIVAADYSRLLQCWKCDLQCNVVFDKETCYYGPPTSLSKVCINNCFFF